ncbi:MAG TPA: HD domain-containing phosphohydrolase [Syntrophorhabdaceae bacterium]|nr:HD domain-containing phosphohydrolase [Syntrophorhabdaceae bacterium]
MISGSKILLVDDNVQIIEILSEFFALNSCEIHKAYTGKEALEVLSKEDIEVVILDVKLPDINGINLLDTIRENRPTTSVIMATGYYDPKFVVDAMKKGASDFLLKPFELDKLMLIMMRVLRERKLLIEREAILHNLEDKKKIEVLNRELQKKIKELTTMYHISNQFNSINIYDDVYEKMIRMVGDILDVKSCGYYVTDTDRNELVMYTGFTDDDSKQMLSGKRIPLFDTPICDTGISKRHAIKDGRIYLPLIIKSESIGYIIAETNGNGKNNGHLENDAFILKLIAEKASTHIENRMLYESLFENILQTLKSLIIAINKRDMYTEGHCKRVTDMCLRLGKRMGVNDYEMDVLRVVGPVHDLGKIGIPDTILLKPAKLTDDEYDIMKSHSVYGEEIMSRFEILSREATIIRHHHERYDGRGYPDHLAGNDIPTCARIIAVSDSYDAMVSDRPYRRASTCD